MKRKGFTLIELLAVIVILAIIALIAVPMVLDVIEQARRGAFEQSLNNVAKAVELYQAREELHDSLTECRYFSFGNDVEEVTQRDNKTYYPIKDLDIKGSLPTEGEIEICPTNIAIEASNGSYTGRYDGDKTNVVKGDLASTDIEEPIIDIFNTTSTIDQIIVTTSAHSASEYGTIEYYYYKLNDGDYIKTTSKSYLFTNLEAGTEYTVYVKVENKSGITSEKSKTVVTKSFGDINIDVEKVGEWTNSKTVILTGDTDGYTLEYRIRRYNEETGLEEESDYTEYTEPIVLNSVATEEHPIIIIVRYRNGNITSDEKSLSITKIDTTAPTSTSPAVTVSTTKPTSELNVIIRQADAESGFNNSTIEYGYSTSQGGTYTWQSNSTLTGLNAGTTYYIKTRVTNNVGMTTESEVNSYTMGSISTCSVTSSSSGWMASKTATITGSQTGTQLQYQIGSTSENGWINITSGGETPAITSNTIVYCRLFDGTSAGTHGQGAITKIDITAPTVEIGNVTSTTATTGTNPSSITIQFTVTDTESGIKETKCMYAQSQDYLGFGSMPPYYAGTVTASGNTCIINGLRANSTYYYKVVTTNNAGISTEKLGQTKTLAQKVELKDASDDIMNTYKFKGIISELSCSGSGPASIYQDSWEAGDIVYLLEDQSLTCSYGPSSVHFDYKEGYYQIMEDITDDYLTMDYYTEYLGASYLVSGS